MEKLVLLVDDDKLPMKYYVEALRDKGFSVDQCFEPDSAIEFVEKTGSQIDIIIMDIMMPPGKRYESGDTNEGLKTGIFLFKDLRAYCPDTPIIVLTNVKNPKTLDEFKKGPLLKVVEKMKCPPFELAELIDEMLSGG